MCVSVCVYIGHSTTYMHLVLYGKIFKVKEEHLNSVNLTKLLSLLHNKFCLIHKQLTMLFYQ